MRALTLFEADDGSHWETAEAAHERDALCARITLAIKPLGPRPDLGHGRSVQQERDACLEAKRALVAIALETCGDFPVFKENEPDDIHPMSIAGRIIDDHGGPLARAWSRLCRINWDSFREYDQPYFALHPERAEAA